jgi:hypothetical protein
MKLNATLAVSAVALLAACGGGGGSVSTTLPAYNYTEGSPSSESNADQAITSSTTYSLPYIAPNGASYSSLSAANTALNSGGDAVATRDTNARSAWQQGWTGRGVKIGVADGFNSNGVIDAHGDWVVVVAASVAPEATFAMRDVLSSATLVAQLGDVDAAYTYFEQNGYHIINNSWGVERPVRNSSGAYTGALYSDFDSLVNATVAAFDPNSPSSAQGLYILAGGNGAEHCPTRRIENCNWMAAVLDQIRDAGYAGGVRTIFVGSLADNSDNLAVYSYYAGDLKNDFIVAHDDVFTAGDASGTSFAAPRVAGAAALVEHKFPNLSSAQIKQVLLQTADDLGAPGVDEVYGHGRLNILNALSPQGSVVPR